ncbi:histidine triad nucleotide-binding protein 3 [Caerostris extrusa]|uniref:Histidine triad nucleotide-binding protein 3 n=1 Tax=Caerostris extrusa TaxID=172846 RepID=A0AAV4TH01_CAEEX|nr:histidine triad nucleotide-binding protein 3 [Caerostris extrusa]
MPMTEPMVGHELNLKKKGIFACTFRWISFLSPKMTDVKKDEKCLFCCIKDKSTEIIFEDEEYLAFRDIKPATSHHYLIIPKSHMTNTSSLLPSDIPIELCTLIYFHQTFLSTHILPFIVCQFSILSFERPGKNLQMNDFKNKRLVEIGEIILKNNSASISDARFGFHVPPFNSIRHLHLHAISCVNEMGFISRLIFKPDSYWFITASTLIEKLEKSNENEKGN